MLENLPGFVGQALKAVRPGLEKVLYTEVEAPEALTVESDAFADGGAIPARFTADGEGLSFPLRWSGVPEDANAIIVAIEDADSPSPAPLVHALLIDEPGRDGELAEGALKSAGAEGEGHALGRNSYLQAQYIAPDPPPGHGPHRYVVQVYALRRAGGFEHTAGRTEVRKALASGVLAKGRLIGIYERP